MNTDAVVAAQAEAESVDEREVPPRPSGRGDWEYITVERAEEMLAAAAKQRKPMAAHETYLANEMTRGWEHENPQPVIVAQSGDTIEGQHRLRAIVRAGVPIWLYVMRNVPDRVFEVLDTGRPRRVSDILSISYRELNAATLASAAGLLWRYEHQTMTSIRERRAPQETKEYIHQFHPGLIRCLDNPSSLTFCLPSGPAAFCRYIFSTLHEVAAAQFLADVASGETERETPARELRERLIATRGARRQVRAEEKVAWAIKAWNAYREGRPVLHLAWRPKQERYPVAR